MFFDTYLIQKQSSRGVLRKRYSENMQQIYRRAPMPSCDFNKVVSQLYWNHTSAWVSYCKFAAYFQNIFYQINLWRAASVNTKFQIQVTLGLSLAIVATAQWKYLQKQLPVGNMKKGCFRTFWKKYRKAPMMGSYFLQKTCRNSLATLLKSNPS